jgi:alpha-glucosidase
MREAAARRFLVALNFSGKPAAVTCAGLPSIGTVMLSTSLDREGERFDERIELRADEGIVALLTEE